MGGVVNTVSQVAGAVMDPLNITGYGGVPGVNSDGKTITDAVSDIKGDITGSHATDAAIAAQTSATGKANAAIGGTYKEQQGYLNPYKDAGLTALEQLQSGDFAKNIEMDPGYQFRLQEGNTAINNAAAARGMGNSGATMKALTKYGQDLASQEYGNAYNRQYQNLSQLAGMGSAASNNLASAAGSYGSNLSNNYMGLGNATAAANIAQGNNMSNMIGQGMGAAATFFSDERLKTDIEPVSKEDLADMRKELKAFAFKYKNEVYGKGVWIGVMAQDLEKTKLGKTLVIEDENGLKTIDLNKTMSLFLATMAEG